MIVKPKIRGFICTTAHPVGAEMAVKKQIDFVKSKPQISGMKNVLVIGASMGYGLASRISAAFSGNASTIGVIFDKEGSENRTGSAGYYNTLAFEKFAKADGLYAKTINGDAFSAEIKAETIELIKKGLGKIDLVIYSLAAPKRMDKNGVLHSSVLKTVGESYTNKTINLKDMSISDVTIEPASDDEISATVKVMGGEDWNDWILALKEADVLSENALTFAYSYIGPSLTHPMYLEGTIGKAKEHLAETARKITNEIAGVSAYVSVNKALVTQSSSAIPIVPLYISILYKIMKEAGTHEGCIEQMQRMFADKIFAGKVITDENLLIRMDDLEMMPEIQDKVTEAWEKITTENLKDYADVDGYQADFAEIFGFGIDNVDYEADCVIDEKLC